MANCPKCNYHLKPWNVKAECPECGVNIPNYKWEERLEEDAVRSEIAFEKLRAHIANFKSALIGNRLRKARLIFVFVPLVLIVLPYAWIQLDLPFLSGEKTLSLLSVILMLVKNFDIGAVLSIATSSHIGNAMLPLVLCIVMMVLSIVAGVANFLLTLIRAHRLGYIGNIVCCTLSTLFVAASGICYHVFLQQFAASDLAGVLVLSKWGPCIFIGILLFGINIAFNVIVGRTLQKEKTELSKKQQETTV
ncbi:MAG: hypothetical protein IJO14_07460 [Clostridia bacterium]|nr:hypothetical protein [Clostridia bacterium]